MRSFGIPVDIIGVQKTVPTKENPQRITNFTKLYTDTATEACLKLAFLGLQLTKYAVSSTAEGQRMIAVSQS